MRKQLEAVQLLDSKNDWIKKIKKKKSFKQHKMICNKIFSDIRHEKNIYVRLDREINRNDNREVNDVFFAEITSVRFSILSDMMIDYDNIMFYSAYDEELQTCYRPYFASFVLELTQENYNKLSQLENAWYNANFVPTDNLEAFILMYNRDRNDEQNEERENRNENTNEHDAFLRMDGNLQISASPVNQIEGSLIVFKNQAMSHEVLRRIHDVYNEKRFPITKRWEIHKLLKSLWCRVDKRNGNAIKPDLLKYIDIYNVGHGNADYIRGTNARILYDIGYNRQPTRSISYKAPRFPRATNAIRNIRPDCVVLSHWDLDHIMGCAYANQSVFNVKWIAPYLVSKRDKNASPNSVRIANYLYELGNLRLVDRNQVNKCLASIQCDDGTRMYLRLGHGTGNLSVKNREGLFWEIQGGTQCGDILLAGDVGYENMGNHFPNRLDFMHVPHHCSRMKLDPLLGMINKNPQDTNWAVISAYRRKNGPSKGLINVDKKHRKELNRKFANVQATIEHSSGDDERNLAIRYECRSGNVRLR